jgi:preprotein translocase subunit SecA
LSSIDELWMRHIDAMTQLREAVAFEWYAQRNPLIVYKEKAFQKFEDLINEIEYKVVKAIFSVKKIIQVQQIDLSSQNLQIGNWNVNISLPQGQGGVKSNTNPLFANPNAWNPLFNQPNSWSSWEVKKTKIRI